MYDLVIIGAGPAGIAAAYEAKRAGLNYVVLEKGLLANTIYGYPVGLTVFSTTNELEFNEGDLDPARDKPTREELLSYYVHFVLENDLHVRTEETVNSVQPVVPSETGDAGSSKRYFSIVTDKGQYDAVTVLFAIGAMDYPRSLNVPGEDLPKVHKHFRETYPWVRKRALVVGGGNSAGEAALFLAREGAETTLAIFRDDWQNNDPKQGCIKYWVKQPLEEQLGEHCLSLFFLGRVCEIREGEVELESESGEKVVIPNDVVFILIGSDADLSMLTALGVAAEAGKHGVVPVYDPETFETNVSGVYVAGHFTHQRHIKGAIDAGRAAVAAMTGKEKRHSPRANASAQNESPS